MNEKPVITIVADNPNSWIHPYARELQKKLQDRGYKTFFLASAKKIKKGGIAVFLSCEEIVAPTILNRSTHNIVIHSSPLPKGRGMSPLTWQIIEGRKRITTTLFEIVEQVDAGRIYLQKDIVFMGHELIDEMRDAQGKCITDLVLEFVDAYPPSKGRLQRGTPTYYPRRRPKDSQIDINKTIKEQFNLLRVVDNDRYPAHFSYMGHTYILKIYKKKD